MVASYIDMSITSVLEQLISYLTWNWTQMIGQIHCLLTFGNAQPVE